MNFNKIDLNSLLCLWGALPYYIAKLKLNTRRIIRTYT